MLIVDDHQTFAQSLALALDAEADVRCVGAVGDADTALEAAHRLHPDVALVDVRLGEQDGLALAQRLVDAHPLLSVVMLTASTDPADIACAAGAGACGFVRKSGQLSEVLAAVRGARPGRLLLDSSMVLDLVALERRTVGRAGAAGRGPALTARERQVLELLGAGLDVHAIARRLGLRTSTCRGYVQHLLVKLDVHTQLEAVVRAVELGLLSVGTPELPASLARDRGPA